VKEQEAKLAALKARLAQAGKATRGRLLPHPRAIQGYLANLLRLIEADPARARQELLAFVAPLVLTPTPEGYKVTGALNMTIALVRGAQKLETPEGSASGVSGLNGSGGELVDLPETFWPVTMML
jgi:hypothetical protein